MDFGAIIGLIVGLGLIVYGCFDGGTIANFYSLSSIAITVGGTVAATFISFPLASFKYIPQHMKILVQKNQYVPKKYIEKIVDYAQEARRKGLLSLEDKASVEEDPFFKNCIMLIVDAIEPTKAKEMLENELDCLDERHSKAFQLYEKAATFAPAYGMIGTLIGLINMLKALNVEADGAAATLGDGMSIALITTFYGSLLANMVLMPLSNRLRARHAQEMLCKEMIVEGVLAIHSGTNPRHIEERLKAYINTKEREAREDQENTKAPRKRAKKEK